MADISKILSGAILGVDGFDVTVEVDLSQGLPSFEIVGLPDSAVKESKERVRTAIKNSGFLLPPKKITINLAPADVRKEGPSFDLPIAIGILSCMGIINQKRIENIFITGELSLDGSVRPVNGVLPLVWNAKESGAKSAIVPFENASEASLIKGINVLPINTLKELVEFSKGKDIPPHVFDEKEAFSDNETFDFLDYSDVRGQESVKRALEISAAGNHNLLMIGPPGTGKTMMAKRLPSILPDMSFEESIAVTKLYSVAGHLKTKGSLITKRPFRSPHHTISYSALTGGGRNPKPGEISLSHLGVLFLDELPEFQKNVLEDMRQPLEDGYVTIARVNNTIRYPSKFMLVASMNPCPCGFYGEKDKCTCSQAEINKYLGKISGPLLDRIDIQIEVPKVEYGKLTSDIKPESSSSIKTRVTKALEIQKKRFEGTEIIFNSQMSTSQIDEFCKLDSEGRQMLKNAFDIMGLSARAHHKILKVARTIADLEESDKISTLHLSEAIQYRSLDRKYWR